VPDETPDDGKVTGSPDDDDGAATTSGDPAAESPSEAAPAENLPAEDPPVEEPPGEEQVENEQAAGDRPAPVRPESTPKAEPEQQFTPQAPSGLSHLKRAVSKKPSTRHLLVAILLAAFGFASVEQVRGDETDVLEGVRRDELGRILVDLTRQGDRLEGDVRELERTKRDLLSSADQEAAAQLSAAERLQRLKVLTGEIPVTGPGIVLNIAGPVEDDTLLTTVAELRAAGAEAIEIVGADDTAVRVVVDTYFLGADEEGVVMISGQSVREPYTIVAIGEPSTLAQTVEFPNGIRFHVESDDAEVIVSQSEDLTIETLLVPGEREYARPAPDDEEE
jgi:uncharacterized protein YlxW (UPF0749 family)